MWNSLSCTSMMNAKRLCLICHLPGNFLFSPYVSLYHYPSILVSFPYFILCIYFTTPSLSLFLVLFYVFIYLSSIFLGCFNFVRKVTYKKWLSHLCRMFSCFNLFLFFSNETQFVERERTKRERNWKWWKMKGKKKEYNESFEFGINDTVDVDNNKKKAWIVILLHM